MNLADLEMFVRAAELGGFSAAARALRVTPSAVSRGVSRLEETLGVTLLSRSTRALSLTDHGQQLLQRGRRLLDEVRDIGESFEGAATSASGRLRADVPAALGRIVLAKRLPAFLAKHPALRLELTLRDYFSDLVAEGLDVAIRIGPLRDSALVARKLGELRMIACASKGYLRKHGHPRTAADLARHNCLGFVRDGRPSDWYLGPPGDLSPVEISGSYHSNDAEALIAAATASLGIVYLLEFIVADALARGDLVPILPSLSTLTRPVHAVFAPGRAELPKVRAFASFVGDALRAPRRTGPRAPRR